MPVYDRRYKGYVGERRSSRTLFLTVARFGLVDLFSSKLVLVLFVASCLPFLPFATLVYLGNNLDVLSVFQGFDATPLMKPLEGSLFFWFLVAQSMFAFVLASFVTPSLVGPDLVHGAMPLYLSRPISRADYVLGKLTVLITLLSAVTWVPGILLVGLQAAMARQGWLLERWRLPVALFVGSWIWILLLALLSLAISAWIRWRPLATSALFALFILGTAFGTAINEMLDTRWGKLLMLSEMVQTLWVALFGEVPPGGGELARDPLPIAVCCVALAAVALATLAVLRKKIRAFEVVR